jgi:hypothetical protein
MCTGSKTVFLHIIIPFRRSIHTLFYIPNKSSGKLRNFLLKHEMKNKYRCERKQSEALFPLLSSARNYVLAGSNFAAKDRNSGLKIKYAELCTNIAIQQAICICSVCKLFSRRFFLFSKFNRIALGSFPNQQTNRERAKIVFVGGGEHTLLTFPRGWG